MSSNNVFDIRYVNCYFDKTSRENLRRAKVFCNRSNINVYILLYLSYDLP